MRTVDRTLRMLRSARGARTAILCLLLTTLLVGVLVSAQQAQAVVNPSLALSTYLGGASDDGAQAIAIDAQGNVLIAGWTYSTQIPGTIGSKVDRDVFVVKLNPTGTQVLYSAILGGSADESAYALAVDTQGNAWITGETASANFPTKHAFWPYKGGYDTFVAKLSPSGALLASSFLGELDADKGNAIAVDPQGNAYVVGEIPFTYGPAVLIAKIAAAGDQLIYRGYFGQAERGFNKGSRGLAAAVDAQGQLYVAGTTDSIAFQADGLIKQCVTNDGTDCTRSDAFVAVINPAGDGISASTMLGGSEAEEATGVAFDQAGNIYVSGSTFSTNFPLKNAWQTQKKGLDTFTDGFLAKLNPQLTELIYATYYGGDAWDEPHALSVDANNNAAIGGLTSSIDLSVPGAVQSSLTGVCFVGSIERYCYDGFVATFNPSGQLSWATYWGGAFDDMVFGVLSRPSGTYVVGRAESPGLVTTTGVLQRTKAGNEDGFLVKIGPAGDGPPAPGSHRVSLPLTMR